MPSFSSHTLFTFILSSHFTLHTFLLPHTHSLTHSLTHFHSSFIPQHYIIMGKNKPTKPQEKPEYRFLPDDIRCVLPYVFDYTTYAKGRWLHRPLIDILSKEFGGYEIEYWYQAIKSGRVTVNGSQTTPEYVIMNSDRVVHRTHRHEPPVKGVVQLVGETEDLMAVCKPASMPMHPWYGTSTCTSTCTSPCAPLYCVLYTTVHYTTLMYCSIAILCILHCLFH
jgi:hypothetical protein